MCFTADKCFQNFNKILVMSSWSISLVIRSSGTEVEISSVACIGMTGGKVFVKDIHSSSLIKACWNEIYVNVMSLFPSRLLDGCWIFRPLLRIHHQVSFEIHIRGNLVGNRMRIPCNLRFTFVVSRFHQSSRRGEKFLSIFVPQCSIWKGLFATGMHSGMMCIIVIIALMIGRRRLIISETHEVWHWWLCCTDAVRGG